MRILSGIQPTGDPHLGNYFGAIKQHIELQGQGDAYYFIADFHALTTVRDPALLRQATRGVAATYLALGLDPKRATLFKQSDVPEVHELTFLLECVTGMGVLKRAHSFKDRPGFLRKCIPLVRVHKALHVGDAGDAIRVPVGPVKP